MLDHLHALLVVRGGDDSILAIVGAFKSQAARRVNGRRSTPGAPFWQRGFYDHVARDEDDLERCRTYVFENPARWERRQHA
jgi:REP element-mobilizing transposase RayT